LSRLFILQKASNCLQKSYLEVDLITLTFLPFSWI